MRTGGNHLLKNKKNWNVDHFQKNKILEYYILLLGTDMSFRRMSFQLHITLIAKEDAETERFKNTQVIKITETTILRKIDKKRRIDNIRWHDMVINQRNIQ